MMNCQWEMRNAKLHDAETGMTAKTAQDKIRKFYWNPHAWVTNEDIKLFRVPERMRLK